MSCCPEKAVKRLRTVDDIHFRPIYSEKPLTEKFYSKYENVHSAVNATDAKKVNQYADEIEARFSFDLRDHRFSPITENQMYGWYERLMPKGKGDEIDQDLLFHPLKVDDMMTILKKISVDLKKERDYQRI